jgi:glycosyltransferase involved in cell wall biosynthesis
MILHLLYPVLPPVVDGIGDYTCRLAMTLADRVGVTIWTDRGEYAPIEGVTVKPAYAIDRPRHFRSLAPTVLAAPPDWLVIQYNPFSYGRRGYNPTLPAVVRQIRRAAPGVRVGLMVHEPYVPFSDWRSLILGSWHRWQLNALMAVSDVVFFSISPWAEAFRARHPHKRIEHLPVGSNIPNIYAPRDIARQALGIEDDVLVAGVFGSAHPSRLIGYVKQAIEALAARRRIHVLSIGTAGERLRRELDASVPIRDTGVLPASAVSAHFAAMDVYLTPFRKGVSTRRGSFMVGLQHGIATVSTHGEHTDVLLNEQAGRAFLLTSETDARAYVDGTVALADDPERRRQMAVAGQIFFDRHLAWERIASRFLDVLQEEAPRPVSPRILSETAL